MENDSQHPYDSSKGIESLGELLIILSVVFLILLGIAIMVLAVILPATSTIAGYSTKSILDTLIIIWIAFFGIVGTIATIANQSRFS